MHIAEIVNTLEIGGLERVVVDLSIGLKRRGHVPTVICLRGAGPLAAVLKEAGIEVRALGKPEGFHPGTLRGLTRLLRAGRFDVVHTHNALVHHYGAVGGRLAGVPAIVNTRHGLGNFPLVAKTERIFKLACKLTDRVVVVCRAAEEYFQAAVPRHKLTLIYNGIPLEKFLAVPQRTSAAPFVIGTVGRLVPVKNQRLLLEAFRLLAARDPNYRLEILGDGPLRPELEEHSRSLGLNGSVQFHGSSLDVPSFMGRLNAFALTSESEGLPLTLLEAMAAGLPVVATAVGGIPEIVDAAACGWLCSKAAPDSLSGVLQSAAACGELTAMGARGRQYAAREHSLERMVQRYEDLFLELLQRKGRAAA